MGDLWLDMGDRRSAIIGIAALLAVPALHPLLIPVIGVPSHLLWWVHVLPVAVVSYCWGRRAAAAAIVSSMVLLIAAERTFGAGYGTPASWDTAGALATALGGTHLLVAGFALFARASADRLRALFDGAPIGLLSVAPDGLVVAANPAAVRTLGVPADELRKIRLGSLLGETVLLPDAAAHSAVRDMTVRYGRPDGSEAEIEIVRVDPSGTGSTQLAIRDVTARNRMEGRLRQKQKMEALGSLAGSVAHDFNNILSVIGSTADVLLAETKDPAAQHRRDLVTIRTAVDRAARLVKELMTFGRRDIASPGLICPADVVREMEAMIRRLAGDGIRVAFSLEESRAVVTADRTHLDQIILNLVTNARDAMPGGGDLDIAVRRGSKGGAPVVTLRVVDTGTGISEAVRARMFDPYFTTKTSDRGTGLGLATVHSIVRRYGGDIEVHSAPGSGSVFIVALPEADTEGRPARGRAAPVVTSGATLFESRDGADIIAATVG